jgi:hypothetical protein
MHELRKEDSNNSVNNEKSKRKCFKCGKVYHMANKRRSKGSNNVNARKILRIDKP